MATIFKFLLLFIELLSVHGLSRVFRIPEGSSPVFLGSIADTENLTKTAGCRDPGRLRYSVISQQDGHHLLFKINETTGGLSSSVALDRENITMCVFISECLLNVDIAVQSVTGTCFQKVSVFVILTDVNDNSPQFPQTVIHREIYENTPVGADISLPLAHDADADSRFKIQRYSVSPFWSPFSLVYTSVKDGSNTLVLRLSDTLDRELKSKYSLSVSAYDGGTPPRSGNMLVIISILDVNDNQPIFTKDTYEVSVPENSKIGSAVLVLSAADLDSGENGEVKYSFANPNQNRVTKYFGVDSKFGSVSIKHSLENEGGSLFNFTIVAVDGGNPALTSQTTVLISVLDTGNNKPQIIIQLLFSENGAATVPESAVVGRVVALVRARDTDPGDNGEVQCTSENVNFLLQRQDAEYKVVVAVPLDREQISLHNVTVTCRDGGRPPLRSSEQLLVKVLDVNDNSPQFVRARYLMSIEENNDAPSFIGRVSATDNDVGQNANISYFISDSVKNTVTVKEATGEVFVNRSVDREQAAYYNIPVTATDHGSPPRTGTSLIILKVKDQNDNPPNFFNHSYEYFVKENVLPYTHIGNITAEDDDENLNGEVRFYMKIFSVTDVLPFRLYHNGSLVSMGKLDYETTHKYEFQVSAVDHGIPARSASMSVIVFVTDENDHRPHITFPGPDNGSASILQTSSAGTEIAVIQAYDLDSGVNGQLQYSINASRTDLFIVDSSTGLISLRRNILSSEIRTHTLLITVSDLGTPPLKAQSSLDVVVTLDGYSQDGYVKIVVSVVCVTFILAISVTVVLCFLRHTDKQNLEYGAITRNNFFSHCINSEKTRKNSPENSKQKPGIIVLSESNRVTNKTVTFKMNSLKADKKDVSVKCENCKYQVLKKKSARVCYVCGMEETRDECMMKQLDVNSLMQTSHVAHEEETSMEDILSYHEALVRAVTENENSRVTV